MASLWTRQAASTGLDPYRTPPRGGGTGSARRATRARRCEVCVDRTKEKIKNAPEFDEAKHSREPGYLEQFARYYGMPPM
ncbi:hypothetical protein ACFYYB_34865 [Streptomyces sp. NPDC002886]|uniref:hypothetical protein n=1 Tax=Streptomyces sp. NPDC002886 TaxID=3364667 RepID=UPI0036AD2610